MPLPKSLTTVTTLSKYVALALFIILPFITFFIGYHFGGIYNSKTVYEAVPIPMNMTPTPMQSEPTLSPITVNDALELNN